MRSVITAGFCLMLAACGQGDQPKTQTARRTAPPAPRVDRPVEDALAKVPPQQRVPFQSALACRVKANDGKALTITAELVAELSAKLAADPSIAKC